MNKKIVLTVFVLVLLLSSMLGKGLVATISALTTCHVYPGQSIQKAINLVPSGDIVSDVTGVNKTESVEPSIWVSPDGSLPTMFNETERHHNPFSVELKYQTGEAPSPNMVYVLVDSSIYDDIEVSLVQYVIDIETSGFSISVYSGIWGTPEETRTFLQQEFSSNLTGCLLVGDIPEAWYEMDNPTPWGHEEFPTDLYYMDLDGNWTDSDVDGIYDGHGGDVAPEIWIGRLKASTISGDEAYLLNNYFNKTHRYRTGTLSVPQCALVYVDDPWVSLADSDASAVGQIYEQTILVKEEATTNAEDYKNRLPRGYEWVHLRCHGSPTGHSFIARVGARRVSSRDYRSIDPPVLFYQLFVCSAARYTINGYLGGTCIFTDTGGLLAIGSTKTGGILYFRDFYGPLSEGDNIGDAFKEWFIKHGWKSPKWFYGLTILGDPLLKPLMSPPSHDLSILELERSFPCPEPGAPVLVNTTVFNMGTNDETNITIQLLVDGNAIDSVKIDSLKKGTSATVSCTWIPTAKGTYNVSYHVVPVPGENLLYNNILSKTVSVQVSLDRIIILADDDGRNAINRTSLLEFESALTAAGYDYVVWNESSIGNPPLDFLTKFKLVIWTCGDYQNWAVDPTDAETLKSYLAQGGNILLEGQDISCDHDADDFMVNVAHAIHQVDDTGAPGLTVTNPTHPVTFGLPATFTWLIDDYYRLLLIRYGQEFLDIDDGVSPTNGGAEVIQYTGTTWTGVTVFEGASNGSVVYCAFPIYCLAQPERDTLIINSVNWLRARSLTVYSVPSAVTFTINGAPQTTPHTEWLLEGSYTLVMPQTHGGYVWSHWLEDGDTNRTKTIVLTDDTNWTGVFTFSGDVNGDGIVDIKDIIICALAFGSKPGYPNWNPQADGNNDGKVDIFDLVTIAIHFGETL